MGIIWYSACHRPERPYGPEYPLPLGKRHINDRETRTAFPEKWITVSLWRHGAPQGESTRLVSGAVHRDILKLYLGLILRCLLHAVPELVGIDRQHKSAGRGPIVLVESFSEIPNSQAC